MEQLALGIVYKVVTPRQASFPTWTMPWPSDSQVSDLNRVFTKTSATSPLRTGPQIPDPCLVETEASGSWNVNNYKLPPPAPGGKDIERFLGLLHHDGHLAKRQMFRSFNHQSEKVSDVDWSWFAYQIYTCWIGFDVLFVKGCRR